MRVLLALILVIPLTSAGVNEGITWLHDQSASQIGDVVPGAGLNPYQWPAEPVWGVPLDDWREAGLSESTVRILATLAAQGAGDVYPDSVRGDFSLLEEIRSQHDHVAGGALLSWHIWGLTASGVPASDVERLVDQNRLAALQLDDGSVPCNPNYAVPSVDCTAWAVIAMAGTNQTFHSKATAFLASQEEGGNFGNLQSTIWAAVALEMGEGSEAWNYVMSLQGPSGKFHCTSLEVRCAHVWATSEAVAFLAGSYPLRHREQPSIVADGLNFNSTEPVEWHFDGVHFGQTFEATKTGTLYVKGDGWAKVDVVAPEAKSTPLPLLLAIGTLGWATHRRKQHCVDKRRK